ncbi:MAG: sulfate transporter family protein [Siculibacillus sp.]
MAPLPPSATPLSVGAAVRAAIGDLATPPFRGVLLRSLGVTLAIVAVLWALGTRFLTGMAGDLAGAHPLDVPFWLDGVRWAAGLLSGAALMVGLSFLIAPITTGVAGLFLDEVADTVERTHWPADAPGRAMPLGESLGAAARFTALSLVVNLGCVILLLVPGVNLVAFLLGNGWLIGREYFEFAARRLMSAEDAHRLALRHRGTALLAGIAAAAVLSVPVLNLATPLFATAVMVHLVKRASR